MLHGFGFQSGGILAFLFVGMDAQIDLNAFAFGGGLDQAADRGGGEPLAPDQGGDVRLGEDEAEVDLVVAGMTDAKLGQLGVLDELEGDILEEVLDLSGDGFHGERGFGESGRRVAS